MLDQNLDNLIATSPYIASVLYSGHELSHDKPTKNAALEDALIKLHGGYEKHAGSNAVDIQPMPASPQGGYIDRVKAVIDNPDKFAGNSRVFENGELKGFKVAYNPNADNVYLAHELGHAASANDKGVGQAIRNARNSPTAKSILSKASTFAPGAIAAITPGDDDLGLSIAASLIADSPIIADELMASVNAGKIMRKAGMPPTPGQRAKLGAALASYIGTSAGKGAIANVVGNFMDEELAY